MSENCTLPARLDIARVATFCAAAIVGTRLPEARHLARYLLGIGGKVTICNETLLAQEARALEAAHDYDTGTDCIMVEPAKDDNMARMVGGMTLKRQDDGSWYGEDVYDWHPCEKSYGGHWSRALALGSLGENGNASEGGWLSQGFAVPKRVGFCAERLWRSFLPEVAGLVSAFAGAHKATLNVNDAVWPLLGGRPFTTIVHIPAEMVSPSEYLVPAGAGCPCGEQRVDSLEWTTGEDGERYVFCHNCGNEYDPDAFE